MNSLVDGVVRSITASTTISVVVVSFLIGASLSYLFLQSKKSNSKKIENSTINTSNKTRSEVFIEYLSMLKLFE